MKLFAAENLEFKNKISGPLKVHKIDLMTVRLKVLMS